MSKQTNTVHFEWSFAEEGAVWSDAELTTPWIASGYAPPLSQPDADGLVNAPLQGKLLLQVTILLLAGWLTTASVAASRVDEQAILQRQIEAALQQEERAWQQNDVELFRSLLDPDAQRGWRSDWSMAWGIQPDRRVTLGARITGIEAQEEWLQVQTVVNRPMTAWWRATPFREVRFYRRSPSGWLRTQPPPEAWGQVRTVATPHLRFQFHERDTPTILALSVQVERAYLQLYELLGRRPPTTPLTVIFGVVPDQMREFRMSEEPLHFASPQLLKAALGLTEVEYTTHLLISHLADRALLDIFGPAERQQVSRWRIMLWATSGRLRLEVLGQRSPWQQEAEAFFRQTDWSERPLRLTDIDDRYTGITIPREGYLWEYMAAEALVAYVVQVYGWEGVVALFGGFGQSIYWSRVIPFAFDRSAADLEVGWNRYLTETYRITGDSD